MTTNHDGLVSSAKLAALFGVSRMTLSRLATAGVIVREGHGKYRLVPSIQGYLAKLRDEVEKRAEPSATDNLRAAQLRLLTEKANGAALANEKLRQEYVAQTDVSDTWKDMAATIRNGLRSLPERVLRRLPHLSAIGVAALAADVEDVLSILDTGNPRFVPPDKGDTRDRATIAT